MTNKPMLSAELRALLAEIYNHHGTTTDHRGRICALLTETPAAKHQAEPVAWLNVATGHVTTSAVVVMDWDDEKEKVQSLYAEQPAPVAVVMPDLDFSFEHWWKTSGQYCRAGGGDYEKTFGYRAYEAALAEVARLNGVKP